MKRFILHVQFYLRRYINGWQGAVSLLLVLAVSPLLTLAFVLVESARYQSVVQELKAVIDSSAFSVLAEYDPYLEERFGLLALSQGVDGNNGVSNQNGASSGHLTGAFSHYLTANQNLLGGSASIDIGKMAVNGRFALGDPSVLCQQVLEYGEVMALTEILYEGLDIEGFLKTLRKQLDMDEIKKGIDCIKSGSDFADETAALVEKVGKTIGNLNKYREALEAYKACYKEFEEAVVKYAEALEAAEEVLEETETIGEATPADSETAEISLEEESVKEALEKLKEKRDDYASKADSLKEAISISRDDLSGLLHMAKSLLEKTDKLREELSGGSAIQQCAASTTEWLEITAKGIVDFLENTVSSYLEEQANEEIEKLEEQKKILRSLEEGDSHTVTGSWTSVEVAAHYNSLNVTAIPISLQDTLQSFMDEQNRNGGISLEGAASVTLDTMINLATSLLSANFLYDTSLNSNVDGAAFYKASTPDKSSQAVMQSITLLLEACIGLKNALQSSNLVEKFVGVIKAVGKLMHSIANFFAGILNWAKKVLSNAGRYAGSLLSGNAYSVYEDLLLYGYGAYNMPNRITIDSGKSLTGYRYEAIPDMTGGKNSSGLGGALNELVQIAEGEEGKDQAFKGAETEYLLVGSTSECTNQAVAFFDLYMLRLLVDLYPVLTNAENSSIAAGAGLAYGVVKILSVLVEPLLDTIILVNGGEEYLWKGTIYLSYSGFVILQNDLADVALSDTIKSKVKELIKNHNGKPPEKGTIDASYTEHLLLLLLLMSDRDTYLNRLQNLIQTEANVYYTSETNRTVFQLNQAYTYICAEVPYALNPMLHLEALSGNGRFSGIMRRCIGY